MTDNSKNSVRPKVSVVMSLYNSRKYLREAIDSVLCQTLSDFEFIIIDDGSTDGSAEIVHGYHDHRIHFIQQGNKGLPAALNRGIGAAKSNFIARMDPDDICMSNRLEKQFDYMHKHADVVIVGSAAILMDEDGKEVCKFSRPKEHKDLLEVFPGSPFIHPAVMFRRKAYVDAGMYPECMRYGAEDAVLFGRMACQGKLHNMSEALIRYRVTPTAMSRKSVEFRKYLMQATERLISGDVKDINNVMDSLKRSSSRKHDSHYFYHCDLARIYTWSGRSSVLARTHAMTAIRMHSLGIQPYIIFTLSLLPSKWVSTLYCLMKNEGFS